MTIKKLAIVDENDKTVGSENWEEVHRRGILHRGIVAFIFNSEGELLITQRSKFKKLWPLYWDASYATHVKPDETYEKAGERRLPQEIGISTKLEYLLKAHYRSRYRDIGIENEICALLVGKYDGEVVLNQKEAEAYKYVSLKELRNEINKNSRIYTPWIKIELKELETHPYSNRFFKILPQYNKTYKVMPPQIGGK